MGLVRWMAGTLVVVVCFSLPVYADSPVVFGEAAGYEEPGIYMAVDGNQISAERLQDNQIAYEELGSLIHANNLSVQEMMQSTENSRQEYQEIRDYLRTERAGSLKNRNEAKDEGDMESYMEYSALEAIYQSSAESYNKMIRQLNRYFSNKTRISTERQLTNAAQSLMISWQSIELQKEYLNTMENLCRAQYEETLSRQSAGLATEHDVKTAYNSWTNAMVSLDFLADSQASVYQNLCLILGVDGKSVKLEQIPQTDLERIPGMDLETDTDAAIRNNTDMINIRSSSSDASTAGTREKRRMEEELEEKIKTKMHQLYENVMQAKQSYDAAQTGYAGAKLRWSSANQKYSLGMVSKAEYLQEQVRYTQKKTAFQSADLVLFQALETYDWAVIGILTLD